MRRTRLLAALGVGLLAAAAVTTYALAHGGDTSLIHGCVNRSGDLRIVGAAATCRAGETALDWKQKGEPGEAGPAGPEGPVGRDGRDGRDGAAGGGGGVVAPRGIGTLTARGETQGDINGSRPDDRMDVVSYSWGVTSPRDAASGLPTGKRQHKPLTITKPIDRASPLLFYALANNERLPEVVLRLDAPGDEGYWKITLTNASVSERLEQSSAHTDAQELETVSFTYQRIEIVFVDGGITAIDDWATPSA